MRDLRPRRGDEVVEQPRGDVLLLRRQLGQRALQMLVDDVPGATEALERLDPQGVRAGRALLVPQPLHHELEIRRLDPGAALDVCCTLDGSRPPMAGSICPMPTSSSTRSTSSGSTVTSCAGELGEALDGAHDGGASGLAVQAVEPKRVREQAGDATREAIELRERVLAERDEHVDAEGRRRERRGAPRRRTPGQCRRRGRGSTPPPGRGRGTRRGSPAPARAPRARSRWRRRLSPRRRPRRERWPGPRSSARTRRRPAPPAARAASARPLRGGGTICRRRSGRTGP